jgi:putative transposase
MRNAISDGVVGLDLNISNIAFVGDNHAELLPFAEGVPTFERQIRALQRQMERSRRANNPDNYHPDSEGRRGRKTITKKGKCKKGKSRLNNYKRYHIKSGGMVIV